MYIYKDSMNVSLPLAVMLCYDDYDHNPDPNTISATSLLKPMREIVIARQHIDAPKVIDISQLISSRMGSAIHRGTEEAWKNEKALTTALEAKGMLKIKERIRINPTEEEAKEPNIIPVYLENRSQKELEGFIISGKYDIVYNGVLSDYKSTSVWAAVFGSNVDDYRRQGSIYRWLNPEKITKDYIEIQYIFTDWSKQKSKQNRDYPQAKIQTNTYPLYSIEETEEWLRNRIREIKRLAPLEQNHLPLCTRDELWQKNDIWKYYKNPQNISRATKNFDNETDAMTRFMDDGGVGKVIKEPGLVKRCKYCSVIDVCAQAAMFNDQNMLDLS